jgi:predicted molibdopterin-dependent oxidoreductase YjgC
MQAQLPVRYPGYQSVLNPEVREKFEKLYGRELDAEKGITKVTALEMCGEGIHAMLIDGENTLVSDPDRAHSEHALSKLDHLVVIDIFLTETAAMADVVFPATSWAETEGTFASTERRIQRLHAAVTSARRSQTRLVDTQRACEYDGYSRL